MRCRKEVAAPVEDRAIRKELQHLYDRRCTVEMLIRSLERYDHLRAKPVSLTNLRTA